MTRSRILLVEDEPAERRAVGRYLRTRGAFVIEAASVAQALEALCTRPDLAIVDVWLPDGNALPVVERLAQLRPVPPIVALSALASREEAFALAHAGVQAFLSKPATHDALDEAIESVMAHPPPLEPVISRYVGHHSLHDVQHRVRHTMLDQALALSSGNRTGAARLLGMSRQAIQQHVRAGGDRGDEPTE